MLCYVWNIRGSSTKVTRKTTSSSCRALTKQDNPEKGWRPCGTTVIIYHHETMWRVYISQWVTKVGRAHLWGASDQRFVTPARTPKVIWSCRTSILLAHLQLLGNDCCRCHFPYLLLPSLGNKNVLHHVVMPIKFVISFFTNYIKRKSWMLPMLKWVGRLYEDKRIAYLR